MGERKERSNGSYNLSVYTDGSVTKDQAGWKFIVKQGATTFHKSRAVYKDTMSTLTSKVKTINCTVYN